MLKLPYDLKPAHEAEFPGSGFAYTNFVLPDRALLPPKGLKLEKKVSLSSFKV